jgi:phosphatidylglycerol---prolipoprotein diacylglyceryl transferase
MPFSPIVHLAFETGGFSVGGLLYWRTSNAVTQPPDRWTRWGLLAGAAVGAAVGSRGLYMLQYWSALAGQPLAMWLGGKTIVGGLLGAIVGVEVAKRALNWNTSTGDGFVLPVMVAIAIGRVGCQLSGLSDLTYGNVTTLPWGWNYGDGLPRHPTALYEILGIIALAVLLTVARFTTRRGDHFRAFIVGYLLLRFCLDFLKPPFGAASAGALVPELWGALSAIQWVCLAGLAYYGPDIYRWATQGHGRA